MKRSDAEAGVFDDLRAGLEEGIEWARGNKVLSVTQVSLPEPPPAYSAAQIRAIRTRSGMSQGVFSCHLGISSKTLQSWEQGVRRPSALSARFLQIIDLEPTVLRRIPRRREH